MKIKFIVSLMTYLFYCFLKSKISVNVLSQNNHETGKYVKDVFKSKLWLDSSFLFILLVIFFFFDNQTWLMVSFVLIFMISALIQLRCASKIEFKMTPRFKRLMFTTGILYFLIILLFSFIYVEEYTLYYYLFLGFIAYINPIYVMVANIINYPIEAFINKRKKD